MPPQLQNCGGLFLFPAKNRLGQMKQILGKSMVAHRANCNLRTMRIATLAAGAKAAPVGALLVVDTHNENVFCAEVQKTFFAIFRSF